MKFGFLLSLVISAVSASLNAAIEEDIPSFPITTPIPDAITNGVFPSTFKFGVSTSSYQVEGGWLDGGKGFSIWDAYSHIPGMIANNDTGDIANDMYHRYRSDIKLMKKYNIRHYRFSIAWNRIFPTGVAPVNKEAIAYYNDLIDQLLAHDVEPHVTIYHSETPLALTLYPKNPNPFLDLDNFPTWFADYAEVLFQEFGDRVKHWFTFNEPYCSAVFGTTGNVDPYVAAHSAILAHAEVVSRYRSKYQTIQGGTIGIVLNTAHFYPADPSSDVDIAAAQRAYDFNYGWFMDPLTKGSYPQSMIDTLGDRLPTFTDDQQKSLIGSLDFVALNYYFPYLSTSGTFSSSDADSWYKDQNITNYFDSSWPLSQTGWGIYAPGLKDLLIYTQKTYNIPTYVTENGLAWEEPTIRDAVSDVTRQNYLHDHIQAVGDAISAGTDTKGYFIWSFEDNLEWASGYQMHFGIIYIQRPSLIRIEKNSIRWYSKVLEEFYSQNQSKN